MSIIRAARPQSNFYILDKQISEDKRLSWAARGLLIFLLGKPDHWQVSVEALLHCGPDKKGNRKEAIYSYISELIDAGYVTRKKHASGAMDYLVSEVPVDPVEEKPDWANPNQANPNLGYPTLVSTDTKQEFKKKVRTEARASRLAADWQPSEEDLLFCKNERPDLDAMKVATEFRDYWIAVAGEKGRKTDWAATWRNWVRRQRQEFGARKPNGKQAEWDAVMAEFVSQRGNPDDPYTIDMEYSS